MNSSSRVESLARADKKTASTILCQLQGCVVSENRIEPAPFTYCASIHMRRSTAQNNLDMCSSEIRIAASWPADRTREAEVASCICKNDSPEQKLRFRTCERSFHFVHRLERESGLASRNSS